MAVPHSPRRTILASRTSLGIAATLLGGLALAWSVSPSGQHWLTGEVSTTAGTAFGSASSSVAAADRTAQSREVPVHVRDSRTGRFLPAQVNISGTGAAAARTAARTLQVAPTGSRLAMPQAGSYAVRISAPGYDAIDTTFQIDAQPSLPTTVWLPPQAPSLELDTQALAAVECGGCSIVSGHVYDPSTARPLAGVTVQAGQARTMSNAQGGFRLQVPTGHRADLVETPPPGITLTFRKPGFTEQVFEHVPMPDDATAMIVDMQPGTGSYRSDHMHARVRESTATLAMPSFVEPAPTADIDKAMAEDDPGTVALARQLATASATVPVPASIRVGMNCSGRSCSSVSVYAMEDYVGRGLDDEWISSWNGQSLAAGAVAYRSYGAWFVANPISSRYDICSTTSCQVFRSGSVSSTINAARVTRGVVLTRDGKTAAFSEYSAENNAWDNPNDGLNCSNNDLRCGNGNNGSPRNNWPCLSDSVGRGRGCFGHGRGMSQWGTQRWASLHQRDWKWIANHYFNNNNRPGGMRNAFLANLNADTPVTHVLDSFETGVGRFNRSPAWSGSTVGISTASLAERNCTIRRKGSCSLHVLLRDDAATTADWAVRLVSGSGEPAANVRLARAGGKVGFWVYSGGSGMQLGVSIDDSDGTERSVLRSVPAGQWTYLSWSLDDANQWNAWAGGSNGRIDAATVTLDAVWMHRANTRYDVHLYVDDVQIQY